MSEKNKLDRPRGKDGRFISMAECDSKTKEPTSTEVGIVYSQFGGQKILFYNPDALVQKKGGLEVYRKMFAESHVKASLQQKKTALLSVPWDITPASTSPEDIATADFVRWNLQEFLVDSFSTDLYEMLDALDMGFCVLEKIFCTVPDGPWAGKWAYSRFKGKVPDVYAFEQDKYGNILPDGLINTTAADKGNQRLPVDKFFIWSYLSLYSNPYGISDLRAAYRAYWLKDTAWKFRAIYLERFSGNNIKAKFPPGDEKARDKMLEIIRDWQQSTGLVIPNNMEVELMELATSSADQFGKAIQDCNKEILISILGVTLTVDEGQKGGARAMGQVHKQVADLYVLFLDIFMSSEINKQIIRPIVDLNFPNVHSYPKFQFEPRTEITAETIRALKDAGVAIPTEWILKRFKIPVGQGGSGRISKAHIDSLIVTRNEVRESIGQPPLKGSFWEQPIDPETLSTGPAAQALSESVKAPVAKLQDAPDDPEPTTDNGEFWRPMTKLEESVNMQQVNDDLQRVEDAAVIGSQPAYEGIRDSVIKQVDNKGLLKMPESKQAKAIAEAGMIAVNVGELNAQLFNSVLTSDLMGRANQVTEAEVQGFDFGNIKKFAELTSGLTVVVEALEAPITPTEAVKAFSGRIPMSKSQFKNLVELKESEAFYIAGLEKATIEKDVRPLIVQAIKEGTSEKDFVFQMNKLFTKYINPPFNREGTQTDKAIDHHAQTVFRNAMMTSYNEGKEALRSEPEMVEAFPASLYSAIMDNRTSDICSDLDGSVFLNTDPAWQPYKPQNHHRCRSTLIAINKLDFTPDMLTGPPPSSVILPAGFGG